MTKTPEDIKKALLMCSQNHSCTLSSCAYIEKGFPERHCRSIMEEDAFTYITQLEAEKKDLQERINLMLIQMRGDCGCCTHRKGHPILGDATCHNCVTCSTKDNYHPYWEYEGLPEIQNTGGNSNG